MLDEISQHINQHAGTVFMNVNSDEYQCAQIRRFLGKELTILSKRNQRIRKFLFFLLSPHETMYTVMDMSKWEDRREYQRISV